MAFENISKGKFTRSGWKVVNESDDDLICCNGRQYEENSEFIAYCFNLQQHYDISKLEEAVKLLKTQISCLSAGFDITANSILHEEIKVILKQIKK